jgi:hypothetical protein
MPSPTPISCEKTDQDLLIKRLFSVAILLSQAKEKITRAETIEKPKKKKRA